MTNGLKKQHPQQHDYMQSNLEISSTRNSVASLQFDFVTR